VQKLLQAWAQAIAEAEFHYAMAFCARHGARARALHRARREERRAAAIARTLKQEYGVDPETALRNGEIK